MAHSTQAGGSEPRTGATALIERMVYTRAQIVALAADTRLSMTAKTIGMLIWGITETWEAGEAKVVSLSQIMDALASSQGGVSLRAARSAIHALEEAGYICRDGVGSRGQGKAATIGSVRREVGDPLTMVASGPFRVWPKHAFDAWVAENGEQGGEACPTPEGKGNTICPSPQGYPKETCPTPQGHPNCVCPTPKGHPLKGTSITKGTSRAVEGDFSVESDPLPFAADAAERRDPVVEEEACTSPLPGLTEEQPGSNEVEQVGLPAHLTAEQGEEVTSWITYLKALDKWDDSMESLTATSLSLPWSTPVREVVEWVVRIAGAPSEFSASRRSELSQAAATLLAEGETRAGVIWAVGYVIAWKEGRGMNFAAENLRRALSQIDVAETAEEVSLPLPTALSGFVTGAKDRQALKARRDKAQEPFITEQMLSDLTA